MSEHSGWMRGNKAVCKKKLSFIDCIISVYYIFVVLFDNNPCLACPMSRWWWWWWYWWCEVDWLRVTTLHDRIWPPRPYWGHCHIMINTRTIFLFLSEKILVPITHLSEIIGVSLLWEDTMSHLLVNPSLPLPLPLSRIYKYCHCSSDLQIITF